jgi:hypothetical protein
MFITQYITYIYNLMDYYPIEFYSTVILYYFTIINYFM